MSQNSRDRFVPSGVNAQSWLGFEQRIQERRFRALLDSIEQAIAAGDAVAARVAFEEARELRPQAPELPEVEERIAFLPVAAARAASQAAWTRALGAVMILLVGVSLLVGIDWVRANNSAPTDMPVVGSPQVQTTAPVPASTSDTPAVTIVPPPEVEDLVAPPREEIGTGGLERQIRSAIDSGRLRPASTVEVVAPVIPRGEIPDDFVFRTPTTAVTPDAVAARTRTVAAPPVAPAPATAAAAAAPAAAPVIAPPPQDETRVAAVLNEYARAYGRLDVGAAREVWPSVDQRALARAFDNLASQSVAFDNCAIDVQGTTANASCRGRASYVGKVGSREPRIEPRTWRFELRRDGEAWKIENAVAARQ